MCASEDSGERVKQHDQRLGEALETYTPMPAFLNRYYALTLVLALLAPIWLQVILSSGPQRESALYDAFIWSGILLVGWTVVRVIPRYNIRGAWRSPTTEESSLYTRLLLAVLLVDFGSKAFFFRWD